MSDSDDTDVLLLIPPDLFVVLTSDSEDSESPRKRRYSGSGVFTEILDHVQSLESRITAIESKDNSLEVSLLNASLDSQAQPSSYPYAAFSTHRQFGFAHSQFPSLPNTPAKPRYSSSLMSSPGSIRLSPHVTNTKIQETRHVTHVQKSERANPTNANARIWKKHEGLMAINEPSASSSGFAGANFHGTRDRQSLNRCKSNSRRINSTCKSTGSQQLEESKEVKEMELSEVDELLQEMEATEIELAKRINSSNSLRLSNAGSKNNFDESDAALFQPQSARKSQLPMRRLDFQFVDNERQENFDMLSFRRDKSKNFADVSLPDEDHLEESDKIISSFKTWEPSSQRTLINNSERQSTNSTKIAEKVKDNSGTVNGNVNKFCGTDEVNNRQMGNASRSKIPENPSRSSETSDAESHILSTKSSNCRSLPNIQHSIIPHSILNDYNKNRTVFEETNNKTDDTVDSGLQGTRQSHCTFDFHQTVREIQNMGQPGRKSSTVGHNELEPRKQQRLPTLSDFWDCDGKKSQEEMLRIKLEEEKFRREHCEHVIQELQKRLLEQQEKVAVAIRVDNEKNSAISQFQNGWSNLKLRWETLEKENSELSATLKNVTEKHQSEIAEYQQQIKRGEGELSKALDLAAGYKEKSDNLVKEKLDLLKDHADELEKYKSLVQEAEQRFENLKLDYNKLLEKSKQLEEINTNTQHELNKERLRSSEVRNEMAVIHKALDACEAELTILRQEKENLNLKIKEEATRNGILEQNKAAMLQAINEAKDAEKAAKDEAKALVDRQEQIRSELREVYQNQVDDVVKTKLKEFQHQLDAAEMAFQADLETRQRAIAECAARKIKSVIDKHQLEINLLEEKHMEEKRLGEIQLAQASQKAAMLETQLNMQRATKTQLAEQLHSVMQKQWQQALQIISGGNMENLSPLQRLNAERFFEANKAKRCTSECCKKESRELKELRSSSSQHNVQSTNFRQEQDESLITLTSNDETPVTTRKESKDDLRKYIKMILDMQQPKHSFVGAKYTEQREPSPPPVTREVPRKHYTKKEQNGLSEESATWQQVEEQSVHDTSEYIPLPQSQGHKSDQQRYKPPWK